MGVLSGTPTAPGVASYDLSANAGETSDINKGDYAKLVFDVTNGQDLNFLAAMGNVTNMTIIPIGDPADGNKQITVVLQIVDTVASAADPDGSIVSAAGALAFAMDKNAAGTVDSLTPDQGKTIFQTDFFYQDLTVPTLDAAGKGVAIRADGILGVEGTFTALIPETTIAALGLTRKLSADPAMKLSPTDFHSVKMVRQPSMVKPITAIRSKTAPGANTTCNLVNPVAIQSLIQSSRIRVRLIVWSKKDRAL